MKKLASIAVVLCALAFPRSSHAELNSTLSGEALGSGVDALSVQMGWPGISGTYFHGVNDQFDIGGRFTFNYGFEGITTVVPGLKLQGVFRIQFVDRPKFNFGLVLDPGVLFYFPPFAAQIGMALPVHLVFGLPVKDNVMVNFGMDMPMFVIFTGGGSFVIPILFGAGFEYAIDSGMALTLNSRFGPAIATTGGASFCFNLLFGLTFRL